MPSGKTHDAVTFFLAVPIWAAAWNFGGELIAAFVIVGAFMFGGLMFGPDLDTVSIQNSRWGLLKSLWYPYQKFFKHRSRWSHGMVFGTLFRVIYFVGVLTLFAFLITFCVSIYLGGDVPHLFEFTKNWQSIGNSVRSILGENVFYFVFIGLWLGAASHTLTDMAGSYVKTGRVTEFL